MCMDLGRGRCEFTPEPEEGEEGDDVGDDGYERHQQEMQEDRLRNGS